MIDSTRDGTADDGNGRPLCILVAEDDAINQKVIAAHLGRLGYRVDIAVNGQEAVEAATRIRYDLILMDIHMPVLDGIEAARQIRRLDGDRSRVPIIAVTANTMFELSERVDGAEIDDFVPKPIHTDALLAAIDRQLGTEGGSSWRGPAADR